MYSNRSIYYVLLYCVVIESIVLVECTLVVVCDKVCIIHYGCMYERLLDVILIFVIMYYE